MIRSCFTPSFTRIKSIPTLFAPKNVARFTVQVLRKDDIYDTYSLRIPNDGCLSSTFKRDHSALSNSAAGMYVQYSHNTQIGTCRSTARNTHNSIYVGCRGMKYDKHSISFLTQGRQPTTTELASCSDFGFDGLDVRRESNGGYALPILNASVILAPGQYCKKSSKSGAHAAQRLVTGRRSFEQVMLNELFADTDGSDAADNGNRNPVIKEERVRKLYVLVGHGVPNSLLEHFVSTGREWLRFPSLTSDAGDESAAQMRSMPTPTHSQHRNSAIQISMCSVSRSTLLDPDRILKTHSNGTTSLIQWPVEWGHDLELFMVVMNRICSRLSSVVMRHNNEKGDDKNSPYTEAQSVLNNFTPGTGSVIIPSKLLQWNVTIRKGEMLPFYLLPPLGAISGSQKESNPPIMTVEWIRNGFNCWKIVLRLQDEVMHTKNSLGAMKKRDPISMMFEGVYESL
eukprot:CCRYP_017492-RA/>CCRYP_017492-RA protein AED:0.02 eAED:0.02 QI:161/1/1/1/1/1/2/511/454